MISVFYELRSATVYMGALPGFAVPQTKFQPVCSPFYRGSSTPSGENRGGIVLNTPIVS